MTGKKELKIAKTLFRKSLSDGLVDSQKVKSILKVITREKPAHLVGILRNYKRLLESALSKEQVIVETAAKIPNLPEIEKEIKEKTKARRIIVKINPRLVLGAKITHGDWIFDSTLSAKLNNLIKSA
ncbi:hypothetical protein A2870_01380 [Candidatus Curtissbacteria bacterium RIFCSPHIGHO2_01_FULL_41_11]|uniref:Uncharacterized protein n=1 Tax=Candidatus Curtissbacteria bacterium RIFCSPHIGHO2_01_FULL_41_11 TaxID=1797711 RepID=A0A1F5G670_9BACT|nr:MAG: hypothetical protein A2870_01380 [Candidatus Curtissbacteria bacterium RIFCSPHIGHO2_01_FULL_41_11]